MTVHKIVPVDVVLQRAPRFELVHSLRQPTHHLLALYLPCINDAVLHTPAAHKVLVFILALGLWVVNLGGHIGQENARYRQTLRGAAAGQASVGGTGEHDAPAVVALQGAPGEGPGLGEQGVLGQVSPQVRGRAEVVDRLGSKKVQHKLARQINRLHDFRKRC